MAESKRQGECEGCNNSPRVLTQIESGQWVCRTCLREIRGPKVHYVPADAVAALRRKGFNVQDSVTREEYRRLMDEYTRTWQLKAVRDAGKVIAEDSPKEEVDRLWRIVRLQQKGVRLSDSATVQQVEESEMKQDETRYFHAKVVGVTHSNPDGTSRQRIIAGCYPCEVLRLQPEPENPVDKNAIAVLRASGKQIGYLDAELACEVAGRIACGWHYIPIIKEIRGEDSPSLGILLLIVAAKPHVSTDTIGKYCEALKKQIHQLQADK